MKYSIQFQLCKSASGLNAAIKNRLPDWLNVVCVCMCVLEDKCIFNTKQT